MKTFVRIIIIVAAAIVVSAITLALVNGADANSALSQSGVPAGDGLAHGGGFQGGRGLRGGHGEGLEGGAFSWAETIKNVVVVAVLVIVVALIERLTRASRTRKLARATVSAAGPDGNGPTVQ